MASPESPQRGSLRPHRQAEAHMGLADAARRRNDRNMANLHDNIAGFYELDAYNLSPKELVTTREVLAISAVALFRKAYDHQSAASTAEILLRDPDIKNPGVRDDLQEMLNESQQVLQETSNLPKQV